MRPEKQSKLLLGVTESQAKMYEYDIPKEHHIAIPKDPVRLLTLAIGLLGDLSAWINTHGTDEAADDLRNDLQFSARYFDAYLESKLDEQLSPYLLILGSVSYYLCNLPGSSSVLAERLGEDYPDMGCRGLDRLLIWLLKGEFDGSLADDSEPYGKHVGDISLHTFLYRRLGVVKDELIALTERLRQTAYAHGTPRQLLFADMIGAIVRKRCQNSTWNCLPVYSAIDVETWSDALRKESFIKELWPAQHLLGIHGVFHGESAVVQMPTSAGKTRSTEIMIRSAFLSKKTSLAVIVAPFRALCHEIRNSLAAAFLGEAVSVEELSDTLQADFDVAQLLSQKQILVVTPEKLVYALRQSPDIAEHIGLVIYDEGHQFDNGARGITYELLLTTLRSMLPKTAQTVLISAVINNAAAVGAWLNGDGGQVVSGGRLIPTYRSVAFASWQFLLGQLIYVTQEDTEEERFFVPRVIEEMVLPRRKYDRGEHRFPDKADSKSIALYLGLKMVRNGSVAIFLGQKRSAPGLCDRVADLFSREPPIKAPAEFSDKAEVDRLYLLHALNLGESASATKSARVGVYAHHGNTPQGIRLAVEYALKEGLVRFVICTSTLAQGVNLPIKYLIVTGVYQGQEQIKVRDFHNLIGRAGRSGKHTEGSIIFADPTIYDRRKVPNEQWRWTQVSDLLKPENTEPCGSSLLSIFDPLRNDSSHGTRHSFTLDILDLAGMYADDQEHIRALAEELAEKLEELGFTVDGLTGQILWRLGVFSAVESYLMANWSDSETERAADGIATLAQGTLAYHLAVSDELRDQIVSLFQILAKHVQESVPLPNARKAFGRTLYGVTECLSIQTWVSENIERLQACRDQNEMLSALWPLLSQHIRNSDFRKCRPQEVLETLASAWIGGSPFCELLEIMVGVGARIGIGKKPLHPTISHVVEICENALGFDGTLVLGAVAEFVRLMELDDSLQLEWNLDELQKRLRYGLTAESIVFCEMGFADRVVAQELSSVVNAAFRHKTPMISAISRQEDQVREALSRYPAYFIDRLDALLA